jgi:hypothetical protein
MTYILRSGFCIFVALACLSGVGCQLRRPNTAPIRTIEPRVLEPANHGTKGATASPVRLLNTQARGHIGHHLLHLQPDGEVTEDSIWRWSSAPEAYLDTALRQEIASNPDFRLVDTDRAPALGATILEWDMESGSETRLVGAVEFEITGTDRMLRTHLVRASETVSGELPGDLAVSAGRLLRHLASEGLAFVKTSNE